MSDVLTLFRAATGREACRYSCEECHEIYNDLKECPIELTTFSGKDVAAFIKGVDKKLRELSSNNTFDYEITEDEFLAVLQEAANETI